MRMERLLSPLLDVGVEAVDVRSVWCSSWGNAAAATLLLSLITDRLFTTTLIAGGGRGRGRGTGRSGGRGRGRTGRGTFFALVCEYSSTRIILTMMFRRCQLRVNPGRSKEAAAPVRTLDAEAVVVEVVRLILPLSEILIFKFKTDPSIHPSIHPQELGAALLLLLPWR